MLIVRAPMAVSLPLAVQPVNSSSIVAYGAALRRPTSRGVMVAAMSLDSTRLGICHAHQGARRSTPPQTIKGQLLSAASPKNTNSKLDSLMARKTPSKRIFKDEMRANGANRIQLQPHLSMTIYCLGLSPRRLPASRRLVRPSL